MHLTNNLLSVQIDQMHFLYLLFCLFIMKQAYCYDIILLTMSRSLVSKLKEYCFLTQGTLRLKRKAKRLSAN